MKFIITYDTKPDDKGKCIYWLSWTKYDKKHSQIFHAVPADNGLPSPDPKRNLPYSLEVEKETIDERLARSS